MSKDIRSFFAPVKKVGASTSNGNDKQATVKKRVYNVIESDDDDDGFIENPSSKKSKEDKPKNKTPTKVKEAKKPPSNPVDVGNFFGKSPVQQKPQTLIKQSASEPEQPKDVTNSKDKGSRSKKKRAKLEKELTLEDHFNDDFEATLLLLDEEKLGITPKKAGKKDTQHEKKSVVVETDDYDQIECTPNEPIAKGNSKSKSSKKESSEKKDVNVDSKKTPEKIKPADSNKTPGEGSSSKKGSVTPILPKTKDDVRLKNRSVEKASKLDLSDSAMERLPCDSDYKRKANAEAYQRFLQRGGPRNPGSKPVPVGAPDCLLKKSFVITGVLESLERDEAAELIHKYGGRTTSTVSKKTSYIVVGDEPGASKLKKAEELKIPQLSEDSLLDLIRNSNSDGKESTKVEEESKYFPKRKKDDTSPPKAKKLKLDEPKTTTKDKVVIPESNFYSKKPIAKSPDSGIGSSLHSDPELPKMSESLPACHSLGDTLWVDKYKPKTTKAIIGQGGERSNVKKLIKWLTDWHKHHSLTGQKKPARPAPWAQGDDGAYYKAALLSGPPGVGKTTTVHLVCQELGFDMVEFNASDTRSKRLLTEQVAELLASKSIRSFCSAGDTVKKKHVLVMDEVDGMAGNEDRGGVQELIQLIKKTRIPIICMCNDRSHPKMRSLVNYCFDLRFHRPRVEQIKGAMMSICFKEGIKVSSEALTDIITAANQDVRQVLHNLSLWATKDKGLTAEQAKEDSSKAKKSFKMGPWDVARQVFSKSDQERMTLREKEELFFQDYSLGPLFVQDTYIHVKPFKAGGNKLKTLECLSRAADSLAWGDVVERKIRSQNAWGLLPVQAIFSSVLPGHEMAGHVMGQIQFPAWLGKNSKRNRMDRLLQELHVHTRLSTSGSKQAVNLDYAQPLRDAVLGPILAHGTEGISASLEVMRKYCMLREDLDTLVELCQWPSRKDIYATIDSKVKSAFTRAYNKECPPTPYAASVSFKKTKHDETELLEGAIEGEDGDFIAGEEDEGTPDDIDADAMIKKVKSKKAPPAKEEAGTSRGKKGKGSRKGKESK